MTEFRAFSTSRAFATAAAPEPPPTIVGVSLAAEQLREEIRRAAISPAPVLIAGEEGTGKSLVARGLHAGGSSPVGLCLTIECQAFPDTLLEIELFGCAAGAGFGVIGERIGALEMVSGGTVILENGEFVSARTQALLARSLATGRVLPVGTMGVGTVFQTRVVVTTSLSADRAVEQFHPELWAQVAAHTFRLPPLRERAGDAIALAEYFAGLVGAEQGVRASFSPEALTALAAYTWPGNVSQLRTVIERLVMRHGGEQIDARQLPVGIRPRPAGPREGRPRPSVAEQLFARVRTSGESFWSSVYPLFMKREITRTDLRELLRRALEAACGDADDLLRVLNIPGADRRRFARFLRKYDCQVTP